LEGVWRVCGGRAKGVWRARGGCVEGARRVCGGCVEGVWRVCGGCVEGVWRVCMWRVCGGCVEGVYVEGVLITGWRRGGRGCTWDLRGACFTPTYMHASMLGNSKAGARLAHTAHGKKNPGAPARQARQQPRMQQLALTSRAAGGGPTAPGALRTARPSGSWRPGCKRWLGGQQAAVRRTAARPAPPTARHERGLPADGVGVGALVAMPAGCM
jgi:hypothetical protein